jgi:hypothetical protein
VNPGALIGNLGWLAASLPEYMRFRKDAMHCERIQRMRLAHYLETNAHTGFGREHGFAGIQSWEEYAERVPLRNYDDYAPWISRIAAGHGGVLTREPVWMFEPSSGSSGPVKRIPFTRSLQKELRRAVAVWATGTFLSDPALLGGHAYWSLTPRFSWEQPGDSVIPVGFEDDSAYLGGLARHFINRTLATHPRLGRLQDMQLFWRLTLLMLLQCRDLRLVSVWHPSYLSLLVQRLRDNWPELLQDLELGFTPPDPALRILPQPGRARELKAMGHGDLHRLWPALRLISCWTDAHAAGSVPQLRGLFPGAAIQAKGLVATEAFISIPLNGIRPLAIRSHFFEFLDQDDRLLGPWQLEAGRRYSVVITTGGGLYRYRLGDCVEVTGFLARTPCLRFLGREDRVADFFGEKLSEQFVADTLAQVFDEFSIRPGFALLAMEQAATPPSYVLYIQLQGEVPDGLPVRLDQMLGANPHYALCRRLGQLGQARVCQVSGNAFEQYAQRMVTLGMRIGDIKPTPLSLHADWHRNFRVQS